MKIERKLNSSIDVRSVRLPQAIDQARFILSNEYTSEQIIDRLLMIWDYHDKSFTIYKSMFPTNIDRIEWGRNFFRIGFLNDGSGSSIFTKSADDDNFKYAVKRLDKVRNYCKGKESEIKNPSDNEFTLDVHKPRVPQSLEDCKIVYDFVKFLFDPSTKKARENISWKDKINALVKFFADKTIEGTWYDSEWGNKPYTIEFTDDKYICKLGGDEYCNVSWTGVKNKNSEEYNEFNEYAPWQCLKEIMEQGNEYSFATPLIFHDMRT